MKYKAILIKYMDENGWSNEDLKEYNTEMLSFKKRILNMYIKEVEHIIEMSEKIKSIDNIKKTKITPKLSISLDKKYFSYKDESELILKAINKVNSSFNSLIKTSKE